MEEKAADPALKGKLEAAIKKLLSTANLETATPRWVCFVVLSFLEVVYCGYAFSGARSAQR